MSRNGSGTASVPNSFSTGTTISSSAVNANFSSVASDLTNSLALDGQSTMTGQIKAATGSAATPSISFGSDTNTGFYRSDADTIGIACGGSSVATISSSGIVDSNSNVVVGLPTGLGPLPWSAATAPTGWVRCNGRTIGNASSGATERANADTVNLFTHLWNNHADSVLAVSGGRGASAAADYAANKTIALFDTRGSAIAGTEDMGSTVAGRINSIHTTSTTIGTRGGAQTHTLSTSEIPSHSHVFSGTTDGGGDHAHTVSQVTATDTSTSGGGQRVTTVSTGSGISTSTAGSHTHTFNGTTVVAGGAGSHANLQPTIVFPMIIKL